MLISLIFLFLENFNPFFEFLSIDDWIYTVMGSIIIISICFTKYGKFKQWNCFIKPILLNYGFTFNFLPVLQKLITNFPVQNKVSDFVQNHKYCFYLAFMTICTTLSIILSFSPFNIEIRYVEGEGQNFEVCRMKGFITHFVVYLIILVVFIMMVTILFLVFVEWNIEKTLFEVRVILSAIYANLLLLIIYFILFFTSINSFTSYYLMQGSILVISSLTNYILLYGYRLIMAFFKKQNLKNLFIHNVNKKFVDSRVSDTIVKNNYPTLYDDSIISNSDKQYESLNDLTKNTTTKNNNNNITSCDIQYSNIDGDPLNEDLNYSINKTSEYDDSDL
ncbi:hypothetical protein BCR32DRAFT_269169 [Anaeromyces robustus]|uniref:G-protein coupled receptors family 3 profile domain-containing protein n=1 Tax=Anaeromyces robustus TaxID=1754192 RepID=A0A1Y1X2D2_9FUNG|nr:hypothetical protein BCR32DRAFT_269169 [Anaeromyces robustus]|eukprot:ORX79943.1 hypothetical protein BCR32DRAFT_269169 [Anaeromyces robustus]